MNIRENPVSKKILVTSVCDFPGCQEEDREVPEGETGTIRPVEVLFYVRSRGRKTKPIVVDMCELHIADTKEWFRLLAKADQSKVTE